MATPPIETKEHEIWCADIHEASNFIRVWETLNALKDKHYAGATIEEIMEYSKLAKADIEKAIARLIRCYPSDNGAAKVDFCQEGTAGPFATRFAQRPGQTILFKMHALSSSCGYKVNFNNS